MDEKNAGGRPRTECVQQIMEECISNKETKRKTSDHGRPEDVGHGGGGEQY